MHHYTKSSHHFLSKHFKCCIWKLLKSGKGVVGHSGLGGTGVEYENGGGVDFSSQGVK